MKRGLFRNGFFATAAALMLAACGGGGGSAGMNFIPAPPTPEPPAPPPPPPSPPPLPAGPIGLTGGPFATYAAYGGGSPQLATSSDSVQFTYSASTDRYTISLPGYQLGELTNAVGFGSFDPKKNVWTDFRGTSSQITVGTTGDVQPGVNVSLPWPGSSDFKYTATGEWYRDSSYGPEGVFAYGLPTTVGDVPTVGSATYSGSLDGITPADGPVWGNVSLSFNFAAGKLAGEMHPTIAPIWDPVDLGTYTFRDTVYSSGSTTFSGAFQVNGSTAPSSFQGTFTGPQAAELMANWSAPYLSPVSNQWSTMAGVWIAKRP